MKYVIGSILLASMVLSFCAKASTDNQETPETIWKRYTEATPKAFKPVDELPKYCTHRERNEGKCK